MTGTGIETGTEIEIGTVLMSRTPTAALTLSSCEPDVPDVRELCERGWRGFVR